MNLSIVKFQYDCQKSIVNDEFDDVIKIVVCCPDCLFSGNFSIILRPSYDHMITHPSVPPKTPRSIFMGAPTKL
jgi:hypothetical protein